MGYQVELDDETFAELQRRAVPLVDTPNSVIRRLLGLSKLLPDGEAPPVPRRHVEDAAQSAGQGGTEQPLRLRATQSPRRTRRSRAQKKAIRAPKGVLLPESQYELPILETLTELGGRAPTSELLDALEGKLDGSLKPLDREPLASGDVRWKNRAQFVRLKLVRGGDMKSPSPRGVWEISDQGRARLTREQM